jgi:hypothetical protein
MLGERRQPRPGIGRAESLVDLGVRPQDRDAQHLTAPPGNLDAASTSRPLPDFSLQDASSASTDLVLAQRRRSRVESRPVGALVGTGSPRALAAGGPSIAQETGVRPGRPRARSRRPGGMFRAAGELENAEMQTSTTGRPGPSAPPPAIGDSGTPSRAIASIAPSAKAVSAVLLPALVLMLAFSFFYVGAFHDPAPHHVRIAVVGSPGATVQLNRLPGDPLDAHQALSLADALSQINDREIYGAYDASRNRLFVASAANRATAIALEETFDRVAASRGGPAARVTDVKPLPQDDPLGTSVFYAVIAWVFGGYIGATLIGLIGSPRSRTRTRAARRIGALACFGVVAGVISVVMLRASFGLFAGHVIALCAVASLTIFASGAATAGIQAAAGPAGTGLVILVFVILGNSASGGPYARPLLPGLWRTIGGLLPPGASVDLGRSALFFSGARIAGPIIVLAVWAALGAALALAFGGRILDPAETEAMAAAGAAM